MSSSLFAFYYLRAEANGGLFAPLAAVLAAIDYFLSEGVAKADSAVLESVVLFLKPLLDERLGFEKTLEPAVELAIFFSSEVITLSYCNLLPPPLLLL